MALSPKDRYTGKIQPANAEYPYGSAQDITTPGDGTGTPWEQNLINDIWGFLQKLLNDASITPTDLPDTILASQYYQALMALLGRATTFVFENTTDLQAGATVLGDTVVFLEKQILKVQATGIAVRFFVVTTVSTSPNLSLGGGLYAEEVFVDTKTDTFGVDVSSSYYTSPVVDAQFKYNKVGNIVTLTTVDLLGSHGSSTEVQLAPNGGNWPSDIIPASQLFAPIIITSVGVEKPGMALIPSSTSSNIVLYATDASSVLNSAAFAITDKGVPPQSFSYAIN